METLLAILTFIKNVLLITFNQLALILGVFFFFGLILYMLSRFTRVVFVKSAGQKLDIYLTGWLGTPVHEIGHAVFCIIFGHKINDIQLFKPDTTDGTLGYVNHSYNPKNIWHKTGNFFIGFGPILFGSILLYFLIQYAIPNSNNLSAIIMSQHTNLSSLKGLLNQFVQLATTTPLILQTLFAPQNMGTWQFWVFMYAALCISSHMELSPPDIKGLLSGLFTIIILFIVLNSIGVFFNVDMGIYLLKLNNYHNYITGIFTFATALSALFFTASFILMNIYTLIRYRKVFHPFA